MLDIAIAVTTAVLMLITAYLGVHVTLHPVESDASKRRYKIGFSSCAIFACLLIGLQAYRANKAQSALDMKLGKIEKNTEEPPTVQVTNNLPPPQVVVPPPTRRAARFWLKMEPSINPSATKYEIHVLALTDGKIQRAKGTVSCAQPFNTGGYLTFLGSTPNLPPVSYGMFLGGASATKQNDFTLQGGDWTVSNPLVFTIIPSDAALFRPESCRLSVPEIE